LGSNALKHQSTLRQRVFGNRERRPRHCAPFISFSHCGVESKRGTIVRSLFVPMKRCVSIFCVYLALCASLILPRPPPKSPLRRRDTNQNEQASTHHSVCCRWPYHSNVPLFAAHVREVQWSHVFQGLLLYPR
jgi:hypothetical protein